MYFFTISHKKVIPDWDDLWGTIAHMGSSQTGMNMCCYDLKNNTQNLINFKCTCLLCIASIVEVAGFLKEAERKEPRKILFYSTNLTCLI